MQDTGMNIIPLARGVPGAMLKVSDIPNKLASPPNTTIAIRAAIHETVAVFKKGDLLDAIDASYSLWQQVCVSCSSIVMSSEKLPRLIPDCLSMGQELPTVYPSSLPPSITPKRQQRYQPRGSLENRPMRITSKAANGREAGQGCYTAPEPSTAIQFRVRG